MTPEEIPRRMNHILYTHSPLRRANLTSLFLCAVCCFACIAVRALPVTSVWKDYLILMAMLIGIVSFSVAITTYVVAYRRAVKGEGK